MSILVTCTFVQNFLMKCEKTKVASADDELELRGDVGPNRGEARKDGSYQGKTVLSDVKSISWVSNINQD